MVWDLLLGVLALAIGVVLVFAGYRLALILLPIWGFVAGFYLGAGATAALLGDGFLSSVLGWVAGLVVGALLAALAYLYWYVAVTILGASVGASVGTGIVALFGAEGGFIMGLFAVIGAFAGAFITMLLDVPKVLLIMLTALQGAGTAIAGLLLVFDQVQRNELRTGAVAATIDESVWWSGMFIVLTIVGLIAQLLLSASYKLTAPRTRLPSVAGAATST